MAQCKLTPHEYIQNAFAPQVAILCSEDADIVCLRNNLKFVELIQPFSRLNGETRICDPQGNPVTIRSLHVLFEDMNRRPPQPTLGKKLLSEVVATTPWDRPTEKLISASGTREAVKLDLQLTTPWYEAWRDTFLHVQYPSDHEFTKHYVACIIVVSSGSENPMEQLNRLSQYQHQQQHQTPARYPKWFSPNILKYYLLVHDVSTTKQEKAEGLLKQMGSMYGEANCHMLSINSRPSGQPDTANVPDPWSQFLHHRNLQDTGGGGGSSSEASSGTGTPWEDVPGFPARVSESNDDFQEMAHPLSPSLPTPPHEDKNGTGEGIIAVEISPDVPVMVNRPNPHSSSTGTVHHGGCLTSSDVDRIRIFVHEFCVRSLLPHVEKQIRFFNEAVTNRSRSKSLLSTTRRWFGGSKAPGNANNSVIYSPEATELQTRRLGDLCFMFGLYEMAYNSYHTAKNDFKSDQAWLYFAGAQEMAALAAFMHNAADYPKRYLEGSLQTYLNVCKVYNFAIRSTLLATEVLKHSGEYGEAAMMFIKLTSEESDLLSALMLEQAAHCFIASRRPLPRKYAFHMTLAGHRFSKAGQRSHSLRAYNQAQQLYAERGWVLAEDHIHFTLGKQAHHLKQLAVGLDAYTQLVDQEKKKNAPSQQSPSQQLTYVREFINTYHQYISQEWDSAEGLPSLPLPVIDQLLTRVMVGAAQEPTGDDSWTVASHVSFEDDTKTNKKWYKLEEELVQFVVLKNPSGYPVVFKPSLQLLTSDTPNTVTPQVPVDEPVAVQVVVSNPLAVSLMLSDVSLLYDFEPKNDSQEESLVSCSTLPGFNLPAGAEELVRIELVPKCKGKLTIKGLVYSICLTPDATAPLPAGHTITTIQGQQSLSVHGPRLNNTHQEKCNIVYAQDNRLQITVTESMPLLSMRLKDVPPVLSSGELCSCDIVITNTGHNPINKLLMATSDPNHVYFTVESSDIPSKHFNVLSKEASWDSAITGRVQDIPLYGGELKGGAALQGKLWLHAPLAPGAFNIELLFYYEPTQQAQGKKRYRLLRHLSSIYVERSLSISVSSSSSQALQRTMATNVETSVMIQEDREAHAANLVIQANNVTDVDSSCSSYTIVGVSANSKAWAISPHSQLQELHLSAGESSVICAQCIHHRSSSNNNNNNGNNSNNKAHQDSIGLLLSLIPFSKPQVLLESWWRFSLRERIKLRDLLEDPPPPNPNPDMVPPPPSQAQQDAQAITNAQTLDMVLTLLWKGVRGDRTTWGQHSIELVRIGDSASAPESPTPQPGDGQLEEKPPLRIIPEEPKKSALAHTPIIHKQVHLVKVSAEFPEEVDHDFTSVRLCNIEFPLTLHNCSGCALVATLNLSPDTGPNSMGSSNQMYSPGASGQLLYVGAATQHITLQPWESHKVQVRSVVSSPGTFSVGSFSITIRQLHSIDKTEPVAEQVCQLQTAIIVRQTSHGGKHLKS